MGMVRGSEAAVFSIAASLLALFCIAAPPCSFEHKLEHKGPNRAWIQEHRPLILVMASSLRTSKSGMKAGGMRGASPQVGGHESHGASKPLET